MRDDEFKSFLKAWSIVIASLSYCYFIPSNLPKGKLRLLSLIPIFFLFTALPLSLSTSRPIFIIILSAFITWLANFKLLLYSFNIGPLSANYAQKSIFRFILFAAFPLKITQNKEPKPNKVLPLNFLSKSLIFALLVLVYHNTRYWVVLCCLMYLMIDLSFGVCRILVGPILGVELDPPSNEPYVSTSLQDFWGKRWNRMISDVLRYTVYQPVRSIAANYLGPKWALAHAVMATFVVSGLMHELMYFYVTRAKPTWEVTWFFVLQGVCVILEMVVKRRLGQKWTLHWALSGPLTVGFVMGTGYWLFFPQLERNNADTKAAEDVIAIGYYLKGFFNMM